MSLPEIVPDECSVHPLTGLISRVETDSPKYSWLNQVDFVAPGAFNGTEVMTVNHYFPNVSFGCHFRKAEIDHSTHSRTIYLMACPTQPLNRLKEAKLGLFPNLCISTLMFLWSCGVVCLKQMLIELFLQGRGGHFETSTVFRVQTSGAME